MKGKTFLILLVAAGILVAFSLLRLGGGKRSGEMQMGDKLFADLPVNAVAGITIADSENKVTLVKGDAVWQVQERGGYPAVFDEIRDVVVKLSRLKIGRSFSASPESLARLALMAPSAADASASGKQITLKDPSGEILADIILGQRRETDSGEDGGQYLKMAEADTVFLVDGNFQFLKTAPAQWLEKEILDIKADDLASVTCYAGDSGTPVYTLARSGKGEAVEMTPVPAGRTADPAKIDQVLDALAPLSIDDVQVADESPPMRGPDQPRLVYQLFDGRRISIFPAFDGKDSYTLRVSAEASMTQAEVADSSEPAVPAGKTGEGEVAEPDTDAPAPKTARQLNEELSPWVFLVKKWQFDSLITQPALLLEELKAEGDKTS